jgi:hypothetical protein
MRLGDAEIGEQLGYEPGFHRGAGRAQFLPPLLRVVENTARHHLGIGCIPQRLSRL